MGSLKIPKPNWITQDKWDHVVIGFPIGMIAFVASHIAMEDLFLSLAIAAFVGLLLGLVKETADKMNPKKKLFDFVDILASGAGAFLGGLFCLIGYLIFA